MPFTLLHRCQSQCRQQRNPGLQPGKGYLWHLVLHHPGERTESTRYLLPSSEVTEYCACTQGNGQRRRRRESLATTPLTAILFAVSFMLCIMKEARKHEYAATVGRSETPWSRRCAMQTPSLTLVRNLSRR